MFKSKQKSGSVLVFTLIMMFMLLSLAMGMISVTLIERKSGGVTGKSIVAFQVADTGAEKVMEVLRKKDPGTQITEPSLFSGLGLSDSDFNDIDCVFSGTLVSGKTFTVTFLDSAGNPIDSSSCSSATISAISQIKSVGNYVGATRAVQVAVAADYWTLSGTSNIYNTNSGNIGIGTTNPYANLAVYGNDGLHLNQTGGGANTPVGGRLTWGGDRSGWQLRFQARNASGLVGTLPGTVMPVMTLVDNGVVGIGTTAPVLGVAGDLTVSRGVNPIYANTGAIFFGSQSNNGYLWYDAAKFNMSKSLYISGCLSTDSPVGGNCPSDFRLKKDITYLTGALNKIDLLKPSSYEFINTSFGQGTQYGLIAQDVEEVFPDLVKTSEAGYKTVNYGIELQMYTIQAVKELKTKNDSLNGEINQLKTLVCQDHPYSDYCRK